MNMHDQEIEVQNPLLEILQPDEIYIDPFEVSEEEANDQGFPILRRDVSSYIWWLEFWGKPDEETRTALKSEGWQFKPYRVQWMNRSPYAKVPEGMYYANGGPAHYAEERAERLESAQEKASERATNYHERSNQMASIIPFGQPMMPGHHSYKADLSYRKRMWRLMDKFCEEYKKAEWLGDKAEDSKKHQQRKKSAMAMSNRLEKLEKDLQHIRRNLQASVKNSREENAQECRRMMTILACEIIPLKHALKDMGGTPFDRLERPLQPGDYIRGRHGAGWVIRVNKTTITMWSWSGDRKWEYKCKKSDFIELLTTAEKIAEYEKKQEA